MYIFRFADGRNENICVFHLQSKVLSAGLVWCRTTAYNVRKVLRSAVALSNGRISAAQHRRNGAADNITSTEYDGICSRQRDARRLEQAQDAGRRARCEQR
jgi:hypothetical protein